MSQITEDNDDENGEDFKTVENDESKNVAADGSEYIDASHPDLTEE